ncbi:BNR-4 repeat-containing protein [Flavicella sediminum]|uniref:BNR-4 repeat-containing protein n=1 Tax=Flavicella sediminum TaxID=2585141 RepID=UPI001121E0D3|nr:BNR-4 repeat-containing protein [Flavicella sediminum]
MKKKTHSNYFKINSFVILLLMITNLFPKKISAQVTFLENSVITDEAFYFWKADDPKPYHYAPAINPHGNCVKVSNGFVFYTWYRGGWADRTLMVSRKKIGEGSWIHVALPAKLSLVGGKGDTHLTTNIGICPIDGTVHLMFDHHNEDLNYIKSKKNIAFGPDSDFTAANFLAQQNYLIPGKKVNGVTYPDLFNNDQGEMYFERRLGSAVGGNIVMTYYDGNSWSPETTIIQGTGPEVSQGERNFCYGTAYFFNGKFYYAYSPRWAESPTTLGEGIYLMELGARMNDKATTVDGKSYDLPIIDHAPFFIADPRSVPSTAGWAGGPQVAISPKNDIYMYIKPKNTDHYNYLKKDGETTFTVDRNKGSLGAMYGNRMYKFIMTGGDFVIKSALAGSYVWREDFRKSVGVNLKKSITIMDNGVIAAVFSENKSSDKVPVHCFVLRIQKEEYQPQTINFGAYLEKTEGDPDFILSASASSGLEVSYTSSNTNIARIVDGHKVRIMGVGTCDIIAHQSGNGVYEKAADRSKTLVINSNVSKSNQTIEFNLQSSTHTWDSADQVLSATASSGLPVQYESTNTDVAVVVDGKLQVKRAGTTAINALQIGNSTYNAAPIVSHEFNVPKRQQVITFQDIPQVTSGDSPFSLQATSNNSDANLRFVCPNNQVAIVWNDQVREVLGAGSATITVTAEENEYYTAAQATKTITVKPKTHLLPTEIEAEYFTTKNGVNVTRWSNSIFYLNSWNTDDFAEYTIDVPSDGTYQVEVFAASPGSLKKLKIMSGSTKLSSISLTVTPSLTVFKGSKANISLKKGLQKIKIVGEVGGFNFDRMKITNGQSSGGVNEGGSEVGVYQLVNVATGKFLGAAGSSQPVMMRDSGDGVDRKWEFVKTTIEGVDYYNIDSKDNGILRATGSGFATGAYLVVSTTKAPPANDSDKIWTVHHDETDNTFRFEAKNTGRFLYHQTDDKFYNLTVDANDERSKWQVIGTGGPLLNVHKYESNISSLKVYPNPTKNEFTIVCEKSNGFKVEIYTILGTKVFEKKVVGNSTEITEKLTRGIYLVVLKTDDQKMIQSKLIVE